MNFIKKLDTILTIQIPVILFVIILVPTPANSQVGPDYEKYFSEYNVTGSFLLYNLNNDDYMYYDSARCNTKFIPASTFKIPNSIIGLETGVIPDENFVIPWDGVKRRPEWDKDMDMRDAIKVSNVPYYQELARRVGETRMKEMLNTLGYGNEDISGGIDQFWLTGGLRISQFEQIDFLKRLYKDELPVSKRSMEIVKDIILLESKPDYKLRGKTGLADYNNKYLGLFIGWVEKDGNAYFFAINITGEKDNQDFIRSRREITEKILRDLRIIY